MEVPLNRRAVCSLLAGGMTALGAVSAPVGAMERSQKSDLARALYGFDSRESPFRDLSGDRIIEWLREHGVNALFVTSSENRDVLRRLREAGIQCFQSQTCFTGRDLYRENPHWRPITASGEEMRPDGWYHGLSPNQPDLRNRRLREFESKLHNPYLNGIWLDFIRFPVRWERPQPRMEEACFQPYSTEAFAAFAHIEIPANRPVREIAEWILREYADQWVAFKVEQIRSWVSEAHTLMRNHRPDMILGMFSVPWLQSDFNNAITRITGQDLRALSAHVDVFSPMAYHRMIGHGVDRIADVTLESREKSGKRVWPIIQAMSEPDELNADEFRRSIDVAADASETGVIIFTVAHAHNENRWPDVRDRFTVLADS